MSAQIDVMAVMDRLEDYYRRHEVLIGPVDDAYSVEHKAARLAIDELIEASRRAERLLRDMAEAGFGDPAQADDLRTALARVGGAK